MDIVDTEQAPDSAAALVAERPLEPAPPPQAPTAEEQAAAAREARLQQLLQRMQQHADFPSLRDSIRSIQGVARSESAHLRALTDEVLGDVALSNKLLRMINTAYYSSVGAGTIDSLARAVTLMGFGPVAMLASSLTLFDKLPKGPDGARVQREFGRGLLAAMLANQFCPIRRIEESAYIAALFQNLGTMLAWMHFPVEAADVEALVGGSDAPAGADLQVASRKVLGISYDELAVEVMRLWGWPEALQQASRKLEPAEPDAPASKDDYLRVVCTAANRLAAELDKADSAPALERCLAEFHRNYAVPIGVAEEDLAPMVERARAQWSDLALVLGIAKLQAKQPKPVAARPRDLPPVGRPAGAAQAQVPGMVADAAQARRPAARPIARSDPRIAPALSDALGTISLHAMSDAPIGDVLELLMTQLRGAMGLQRVVICLRDPASGDLVGRHASGDRGAQVAALFRISIEQPVELFGLLCSRNADTLISDTTDPVIAKRLPQWYRQQVAAPCFVLLPLSIGERPIGLIYGDRNEPNSLAISDHELTLLKALRNQLLMAMRLRGIS